MKFFPGLIFVCAFSLWAQTDESPEISRARTAIEKLRTLVDAGAASRAQLDRAQADLSDAEDAAYLRGTVYSAELNEAQTTEMLAVAQRRVDRRQAAVDRMKKMVEANLV